MHREQSRVQLTFSPQLYLSEAAATYAPTLTMSEEEEGVRIGRDVVFPAAGLKGYCGAAICGGPEARGAPPLADQ